MQTLNMVADAGSDLNLDKWQINRAITRGVLQADVVGGGEYRITGEALEAAVDASAHTQHLNEGFLLVDWRKSKFLSVYQ